MNRNALTVVVLVIVALLAIGAYTQRQTIRSMISGTVPGTDMASPTDNYANPEVSMSPSEASSGASMSSMSKAMVDLAEQNSSGQSGTATITEENGKAVVVLDLSGGSFTTPQPAHIHVGACPTPGTVKYPLTNVVDGKSSTTLAVDMKTLMSQLPLAVNVHKSAAAINTYTACGDLKASASPTP